MLRIAELYVNWLISCRVVSEEERELYVYSAYSIILTLLPMMITIVIGIIMGKIPESLLLIVPFMVLRKTAGGIHLRNHLLCLISSSALLIFFIWIAGFIHSEYLSVLLSLVSSLSLIAFSPIDSENRRLYKEERIKAKHALTGILILIWILYISLLIFAKRLSKYYSAGIMLTALLQLPAVIRSSLKHSE